MRLDNYIFENSNINWYINTIKRDCKPWLRRTKRCSKFFFRGVMLADKDFVKKNVRSDRQPMNMRQKDQNELDDGFQKEFGWRPRSSGVFITTDLDEIKMYGKPNFFFAIGDFKYVWSPNIVDLFSDIPVLRSVLRKKVKPEDVHKSIAKEYYTDDALCLANSKGHEVMVGCKNYYLLSTGSLEGTWREKDKLLRKLLY